MTADEFNKQYKGFLTNDAQEVIDIAAKVNTVIDKEYLCVAKQYVDGFYVELQKK